MDKWWSSFSSFAVFAAGVAAYQRLVSCPRLCFPSYITSRPSMRAWLVRVPCLYTCHFCFYLTVQLQRKAYRPPGWQMGWCLWSFRDEDGCPKTNKHKEWNVVSTETAADRRFSDSLRNRPRPLAACPPPRAGSSPPVSPRQPFPHRAQWPHQENWGRLSAGWCNHRETGLSGLPVEEARN